MESLLIFFLSVGSLFSLSNALKCYVCLDFKTESKQQPCLEQSLNQSYLEDFTDGLYCLKHKKEFKVKMENSQLGDLMLGTKLGVVKRNETKDLQLDRKCVESGPGNIQLEEMASSMVVLKSTLCYCRTDGCNQGCPHHPPTMVLPLILTWLLVILSATQTSAFFTL